MRIPSRGGAGRAGHGVEAGRAMINLGTGWQSQQFKLAEERPDGLVSDINNIGRIRIGLVSPETVRDSWSFGEVKNPETIDYKTYKT